MPYAAPSFFRLLSHSAFIPSSIAAASYVSAPPTLSQLCVKLLVLGDHCQGHGVVLIQEHQGVAVRGIVPMPDGAVAVDNDDTDERVVQVTPSPHVLRRPAIDQEDGLEFLKEGEEGRYG